MLERVQKLLCNYGFCSRRKAEDLIKQGKVKVNKKTITIGDKASEKDEITVDGKSIKKERRVYLMFHKPLHCVTAVTDSHHKTVMDYVKIKERVFPVGRLDYYTSGLLLLTNDGDFANKVMHPSNEVKKTYLVELNKAVTDEDIKKVEKGVMLKDGLTSPAKIKKHFPALLEITIHEGKNKIVRRIFESFGLKIFSLTRIKIGKLSLGELKPGKYKLLTSKELKMIF